MGLFDLFRKKAEPAPLTDQKKLAEVAKYQSKEHQVIKDLQVKPLGKTDSYIEGKAYCRLWNKEIDVDLYDDDIPLDYAEKCVNAMNAMPQELVDTICRAAKQYCLEYLDAVGGAEANGIELTVPVNENTPPREMLKCFEAGSMIVSVPEDPSKIGYQLSGNCDWEEEHGIEIVILDDKLVYLGEFADESPWDDHSTESWNAALSAQRQKDQ